MDCHRFARFARKLADLRAEMAEAGIDCTLSFCTPPGAVTPVAYLIAGAASADLTAARRQFRRHHETLGERGAAPACARACKPPCPPRLPRPPQAA